MMTDQLKKWLEQMGANRISNSDEGLTSCCPFHEDRKPSFTINGKTGLWVCWSASCPYGRGNLVQLLSYGFGWSVKRALDTVGDLPIVVDLDSIPKLPSWENRRRQTSVEPMSEAHLGLYEGCPRYLLSRGFKKSTLREFEVGYDRDTDYAVIPCRDGEGNLVGISKRACSGQEPKWVHENFSRGSIIYNAWKTRWDRSTMPFQKGKGIIVEGQLDVFWMVQLGWPNTISTLSSVVTDLQVNLLCRMYSEVTIFFDHDSAGFKGAYFLAKKLYRRVPTFVAANYPDSAELQELDKIDPSRLNARQIKGVLDTRQPAVEYIAENAAIIADLLATEKRKLKRQTASDRL